MYCSEAKTQIKVMNVILLDPSQCQTKVKRQKRDQDRKKKKETEMDRERRTALRVFHGSVRGQKDHLFSIYSERTAINQSHKRWLSCGNFPKRIFHSSNAIK